MKINVNGGHCQKAPGASGYLNELAEDRAIVSRLLAELVRRGHSVTDGSSNASSVDGDLAYQAEVANSSGAEVAISIHLNAGGGTGCECYYFGGDTAGYDLASRMSLKVANAMGLANRGAKDGSWMYWISNTNMTAVLLEVCFVDSQRDADAYNATSWDALIGAIASAIDGQDSSAPIQAPAPSGPVDNGGDFIGGTYRVNVDALNVRSAPGIQGAVVASYDRGQTVVLDSWYTVGDGYVWGRYTGFSGATRYIAVGRATGSPEPDDYLVLA